MSFQGSFLDGNGHKYESNVHAYRLKYGFSREFIRKYSIYLISPPKRENLEQ